MSGNSFLSNFSFTLIVNLAIKLFWVLGIEVQVQNILGASAYGAYFELFQFAYYFFIVLDLGVSNYNTRVLSGDHSLLKGLFSSMISIKLSLGFVYLIVLFVAATLMGYSTEKIAVVLFIGVNQALLSLMLYLRSNISALHLFKTDALLSVLDRLIMGAICAVLIWLPFFSDSFNIYSFMYAQMAGYMLAVITAFAIVLRKGAELKFTWNKAVFKEMVRLSYPFAILFTLMGLYTRIDAVMLPGLLPGGEFHTGVYASAFRLLEAAIIFAVLLANLLLPMFSRLINQQQKVNTLVKESFMIVLIATVALPLSFFFYSEEIYDMLYNENLEYGSRVFKILFLNFIPISMGYIFGTLLTAGNHIRLLIVISLGGLIVNVVLNLILIPSHQAVGASIASVVTQALVTGTTFLFCLHYFKLSLYDFINIRVITFVLLSSGLFYLCSGNVSNWLLALCLSVVGCLSFALILQLTNPREVLQAFRKE